jgi:hypothetical protein
VALKRLRLSELRSSRTPAAVERVAGEPASADSGGLT